MCGIFVVFRIKERINEPLFSSSLSLLKHRGPDEQHQHVETEPYSIALGHTRLSIVGVDNGKQPLNYKDHLLTVINGEFYDYKSIKNSYQKQGYPFLTQTDSEIILPMYLEHGLDCFSKLNGEFAGIIYDKVQNKLIAFRDRHGIKPLFFQKSERGIVFSSEIKSILRYEQKTPSFNIRELKDKLYYHPWDQDETVFENIYHVKPGHYLIYDIQTGHCTQNPYWQINYEQDNYTQEPLEAILNTYKEKIVKGVERRLVADVPIASYLSGGIDSSVCYGIASTLQGKGIDAFTISFDDKNYDESIQAEKLVKKYSGTQYVLNVSEQQLVDNLKSHIWYLESITFNPHGVAKHLLSKLVREKGYKVVITGEGSDEYNCGYITNVLDAMQANPQHFDSAAIQEKIEVNKGAFLSDDPEEIPIIATLLNGNLSFCSNAIAQMKLINNLFSEDYKEINPEHKFERYFKKYIRETKNWDFLNVSLYYQSITTFAYVLSALGDRTEMAHSVEARLPFLDNDVIDYITTVPPKFKYYNNIDKFLLRESCKEYVTKEHYQTKKHPYLAPPSKKDSPFNTLMQDMFNSQKFLNLGLFDKNKLNRLLESYIHNNNNDPFTNRVLFCILSVAMIQSAFDVV